jgi:phosphoribosylformylglycinamidine synthase
MGQIDDVRRALDLTPVAAGDLVFVLGETGRHLGGAEFARARGLTLESVPTTALARCAARYRAFAAARDAGWVRSAHVAGRGGLAVALAHMTLAGELGLAVELEDVLRDMSEGTAAEALLSESTGRIVLTCAPARAGRVIEALGGHGLRRLGEVRPARAGGGWLEVALAGRTLLAHDAAALRAAFRRGHDA